MHMSNFRFAKQYYFDNCPFMPTRIFACDGNVYEKYWRTENHC